MAILKPGSTVGGKVIETIEGSQIKIDLHNQDYMPHNAALNQYASSPDENGIYLVVDYKRPDGTQYLKSTLSNPGTDGNYQTVTWQFYDEAGTTVSETVVWALTYDVNGIIESKVMA